MSAGFRSPLFLLGLAAAPAASNPGGVRGMLAPWIGGASAPAAAVTGGGCRSFLAFWAGGACAGPSVVTSPSFTVTVGKPNPIYHYDESTRQWEVERHDALLRTEDEEIVQLLAIITGIIH